MRPLTTRSKAQQVAAHLREGIRQGRWKERMPGRTRLAAELGVSPSSIQRGLDVLEREGLLVAQGDHSRRRIVLAPGAVEPRPMHIGILPFGRGSAGRAFVVDLTHQLIETGHRVTETSKTLCDLGMEPRRIARMVGKHAVDAWVVIAGSRDVLAWFAAQPTPVFGFFGGHHEFPMAGCSPLKKPAFLAAVDRLVSLGHRRIVFMLRSHLKSPPSPGLRAFSEAMESHGIAIGSYHVPDWGAEDPEEFHRCLDRLLATTPPTALIVDEAEQFLAALRHLACRGFVAPERISLICTDPDRAFSWYRPAIAHIDWSVDPMVRRVVRWANGVSQGRDDRRKTTVKARFVEGGTIGPVPEGR